MTGEEFELHMDLLAVQARLLLTLPLDQLLEIVQRAETLGPILDPTGMQHGGFRRLHEQRRMLEAAQAFRDTIRQLWPEQTAALTTGGDNNAPANLDRG